MNIQTKVEKLVSILDANGYRVYLGPDGGLCIKYEKVKWVDSYVYIEYGIVNDYFGFAPHIKIDEYLSLKNAKVLSDVLLSMYEVCKQLNGLKIPYQDSSDAETYIKPYLISGYKKLGKRLLYI